jgi:hypothetical protein
MKERGYSDETPVRDIYRDMFENSNVAQVIATPGKFESLTYMKGC